MVEKELELVVLKEGNVLKGIGFNEKDDLNEKDEVEVKLEPGDDIWIYLTKEANSGIFDNSLAEELSVVTHDWESGVKQSYKFTDFFTKEEDCFQHTVCKHPMTVYFVNEEQHDGPLETLKVVPKEK
ncbi:hypothetical protein [Staphylococcus phage vB_StaM_SA1]|nr:hypothetical protein [Staphylococcus phage vB_StaM_SA1]